MQAAVRSAEKNMTLKQFQMNTFIKAVIVSIATSINFSSFLVESVLRIYYLYCEPQNCIDPIRKVFFSCTNYTLGAGNLE